MISSLKTHSQVLMMIKVGIHLIKTVILSTNVVILKCLVVMAEWVLVILLKRHSTIYHPTQD